MQKILLKCDAFKANLDPSLNGRVSAVPLGDSTGVIRWRNHSQRAVGWRALLRVLCSQPPKATHVKMGGTGWLPSFLAQENQCLQQCGTLGTQQV